MAGKPQLEDGYLRIANELMEAILKFDLTLHEQSVLFAVIRKTYGYGKKEDDISASQVGELCGIARPHVSAALNSLAIRNVIGKRKGRFGNIIGVQKDHRKWISATQLKEVVGPTPCTESVQGCTESVHVQNPYSGCTESVQVASTESVHTKDNLPKDNHQKKRSCARQASPELFAKFYEAYPRKKSKAVAERTFAKINPDEQLVNAMIAAIERAMKSGEWSDPKFIPHPATWLNAAGWMDDVQSEYSEAELVVIRAFNDALGDHLGFVTEKPFIGERAAQIRDFMTFSKKPDWIAAYFPWIRQHITFPPGVGFDWTISREGFSNAISGQHSRGKK